MTFTIQLSPDQEAQLQAAAQKQGIDPGQLLERLVAEHLPKAAPSPAEDPTLALFAQWEQEDAQLTPDEVAEENRHWAQIKANLNAERDRAGARRLF